MAIITRDDLVAALGLTTAADVALAEVVVPLACRAVTNYVGFDVEYQADYVELLPNGQAGMEGFDELIDGYEMWGGRVVPRAPRCDPAARNLALSQIPVRGIVSVFEDPSASQSAPPNWQAATQLTEGVDFYVDWERPESAASAKDGFCRTGHIIRTAGVWSRWPRSIKATYACGFTPRELHRQVGRFPEFAAACIAEATKRFNEMKYQQGRPGLLVSESIDGWSQTFAQPQGGADVGLQRALCPAAAKEVEQWVRISRYF